MSNLVTVVTAFVDIGRAEWSGTRNGYLIPPYIKRDKDTYFERFSRLAKIKNPLVVFAKSEDFERLKAIREDLSLVAIDTVFEDHSFLMNKIAAIQQDQNFINFVTNPAVPEYWSPEYVAINLMKSFFVSYAVENNLSDASEWAWLDFGYVREDTFCPPGFEWKFDSKGKINLFCINPFTHSKPIFEIVRTGEVYIQGCHIVAPRDQWTTLKNLVTQSLSTLFNVGLVDDDQTILLMAYRSSPELFNINKVDPKDWFVIFKDFNHD